MKYFEVFENKEEFMVRHDPGVVRFHYQENHDKGEFIDQDGNVMAQLYEADKSKEWFVVAGMFMGEMVLKSIPYYRLVKPSSAHLILTSKYKS
tara:strand:- start:1235 stop:1513 length:279 start_codon:yes stop_codon:yes gene_type:complete